jgi:hypothetical protein
MGNGQGARGNGQWQWAMGNGQWAMGNGNGNGNGQSIRKLFPNTQYFGFPAGRYANGEAMPQALRSVQAQYFGWTQYKCRIPND